jgi:uncharacterized protein
MNTIEPKIKQKWEELLRYFRRYEKVGVALSGGVDSAVVCAAAAHALGSEKVVAFSIQSPMEIQREMEDSSEIANFLGVEQVVIKLNELEDDHIQTNPIDRCYFCKRARMREIKKAASSINIQILVDGSNADDLQDYRPGRKALMEQGVFSPLAETDITKEMVRRLAKWLGLSVWDKPSTPCLASRFPYGISIDQERINQVACAEQFLIQVGFKTVRVRYHQEIARVEIPKEDFDRFLIKHVEVVQHLKQCGFKYVTLDLQGFRSGSLNEGIT